MDVIEAVKARRSIRAFKPDPVPMGIIKEILEIAVRSPSANNTQPWEFAVLTGAALDDVRKANLDAFNKRTPFDPGIPLPDVKWGEPYRGRQLELGIALFRLLGIPKDDFPAKVAWAEKGLRFFDAPATILICVDDSNKDTVYIFDSGAVAQTIALVALHFGLGTCIQRHVTNYQEAIRKNLGLPASKRIIIAVSLGYPDEASPLFKFRSTREPVDSVTTWFGFD
ncbi:MAG: nitroreductase [Deltaproteobacteria bacterium]|nr:nitroreductase [Deltaproteobacteria bacterium]